MRFFYVSKRIYAGIRIYFKSNGQLDSKLILQLVSEINKAPKVKLNYYNFLQEETATETRTKKIISETFLKEFKNINFSSVAFFDKVISLYSSGEFNMYLTIYPKKRSYAPAHLELTFKSSELLDVVVKLVETTFLKEFIYGFIFIGKDWKQTSMQKSLMPVSEFIPGELESKAPEEDELFFYQRNEDKINTCVFKAYWGNFLNRSHLKKLGGLNRVKKEAPVYLVEELQNGAYLQLTKSLNDYGKKDYENKLKELDKYFKPIKITEREKSEFTG